LSPPSISIGQGGLASLNLTLDRGAGESGDVTLGISGASVGVTVKVDPTTLASGSTMGRVTVTADPTAVVGSAMIVITGTGPTGKSSISVPLTVTAPVPILLVDHDGSANNGGNTDASPDDSMFINFLTTAGAKYNVYVVPLDSDGPTFDELKNYTTVIWYTGPSYGGGVNRSTVSAADEVALKAYLNQANRELMLFSTEYVYGLSGTADWTMVTDSFVTDYFGLKGCKVDALNHVTYTATGVGGFAGIDLQLVQDTPLASYTSALNPATGTDVLYTAMLDPDGSGVAATPIAVGRKGVGTAGSSKTMMFALPLVNTADMGAGTKAAAFAKAMAY
jgi:hypothetical protein